MTITFTELEHSVLYSEELGIELARQNDAEYFKWFLASLLFGGRISEQIAKNTYQAFAHHNLLTPREILAAGWKFLVDPIMREGGYVRYDGRKSSQILQDCEMLISRYQGSLLALPEQAADPQALEKLLLTFYGVGPVTVNIFLRELRPYWPKADPRPLPQVVATARKLGIDLTAFSRHTLTFSRVEAGLVRLRKQVHVAA